MQPNKQKQPRIPVRRRGDGPQIKEEGEHNWAVSYADILMVLLSFFILFFSTTEEKKESVIQHIAKATRNLSSYATSPESGIPNTKGKMNSKESVDLDSIKNFLVRNKDIKTKNIGEKLLIYMPDNIYDSGRTVLNPDGNQIVTETLKELKPFSEEIMITFVGHSDQIRIREGFRRYVKNNVDFSAVRASRGAHIAQTLGFDLSKIFIKGTGSYVRDSRSLTIVIEPQTAEIL